MKKIIYLLLLSVIFASCKSKSNIVTSKRASEKKTTKLAENIVDYATDYLGTKYKYGGTTNKGLDCSGLVYISYKNYEILLPRSSYDMSKYGKQIKEKDTQIGDLIFFKTDGKRVINHVGLVTDVDGDDIKFIHSSTQKGVIISSMKEAYYKKTYAQTNRAL